MDYYEGGVIGEAGWVLLLVFITVTLALLLTYLLDRENDDVAPMKTSNNTVKEGGTDKGGSSKQVVNDNDGGGWKCACDEGGSIFLPKSLQRSVGGPSAFLKAGTGNCYHKQM